MDSETVPDGSANGHGTGKVYVRFGPRPTQEMPREWAEQMLADLREKHSAMFAKLLAQAATGDR